MAGLFNGGEWVAYDSLGHVSPLKNTFCFEKNLG